MKNEKIHYNGCSSDSIIAASAGAAQTSVIEGLIETGEELFQQGEYDESIAVYRKLISLGPEQAEFYHRIARVHFEKKEWRAAKHYAQKASNLAPDVAKYHIATAVCSQKDRDLENILIHLKAAKNINPLDFDKRMQWALIYSKIFAGLEKLGWLMGWATLATIWACAFSVTDLWWWLILASIPFLVTSVWNFRKCRYRRAIWALLLYVLWGMSIYLLVAVLLN